MGTGVREATAEESELARRIDRVRVKLIEDYRLAIGVEEDDEGMDDDV